MAKKHSKHKPHSAYASDRDTVTDSTKEESSTTQTGNRSLAALIKNNLAAFIIGILIVITIAVLLLRDYSAAAKVNGERITRAEYIKELEKQNGSKVMDTMITRKLIEQEARKNNITVNDKEIDTTLKQIEDNMKKQGQELDTMLKAEGMTRTQLRDDIRMQKSVEKLLAKQINVTEKDVDTYITQNPQPTPETYETPTPTPLNRNEIKQQLKQEKSQTAYQKWITDLRAKAKISSYITP